MFWYAGIKGRGDQDVGLAGDDVGEDVLDRGLLDHLDHGRILGLFGCGGPGFSEGSLHVFKTHGTGGKESKLAGLRILYT